jgi:protein phosphatase
VAHGGRVAVVAEAVGPGARASGTAPSTVDAFAAALAPLPDDAAAAMPLVQRAFEAANAAARSDDHDNGPARIADAVALVAIAFFRHEAVIAHIGNCRCYRTRRGTVDLLTRDHSVAAELRGVGPANSPESAHDSYALHLQGLLARALGTDERVAPELATHDARAGDRYLLCTGSLCAAVSDEMLAAALTGAETVEGACGELRSRAEASSHTFGAVVLDCAQPERVDTG